jgi:hypothetical protein
MAVAAVATPARAVRSSLPVAAVATPAVVVRRWSPVVAATVEVPSSPRRLRLQ